MNKNLDEPIIVWKDKKFVAGFIFVITSISLGIYGKVLFIVKFYEPVYVVTGLSLYAFSWVLLLAGVFLIGWEAVKLIQYKIHHRVKQTAKKTYHHTKELSKKGYHHTKELSKKGYHHTKELTKKGIEKIANIKT